MFTKKRKRRKLPEEDRRRITRYGEKFAGKLKMGETVGKINRYGNENPVKAFIAILLLVFAGFTASYLMPKPDFKAKVKAGGAAAVAEQNPEEMFKREIMGVYSEMKAIGDSMSAVMDKGKLTREDSIFLVKKYARLQQLDTILNKKYNNK